MHSYIHPLVSVITAFLNEERFISEAIESVLHQDYANWELILVDDGSSDTSSAIAKSFASKYPDKIFCIEHEGHINKGLSASRNKGVEFAKGGLLAFLDADDVWLPTKLKSQVSIFQQIPDVAMVAEASVYWFSWDNATSQDTIVTVGSPQDRVFQPKELFQYLYPLKTGASPCPSGLMITKEALQRAGGFEESFRGKLQLYEDQAFLNKVYLYEKVFISSAAHNKYRQRKGSIVETVHAQGHYHYVRKHFLEWFEAYLKDSGIDDRQINYSLKQALKPYYYPQQYFLTTILPLKIKRFLGKGLIKILK